MNLTRRPTWRHARLPQTHQRTPFASDTRPSAGAPARHRASRPAPVPINAASGWRLSLLRCNASLPFSRVLSIILTVERSLHFQLRRNKLCVRYAPSYDLLHNGGEAFGVRGLTVVIAKRLLVE